MVNTFVCAVEQFQFPELHLWNLYQWEKELDSIKYEPIIISQNFAF